MPCLGGPNSILMGQTSFTESDQAWHIIPTGVEHVDCDSLCKWGTCSRSFYQPSTLPQVLAQVVVQATDLPNSVLGRPLRNNQLSEHKL